MKNKSVKDLLYSMDTQNPNANTLAELHKYIPARELDMEAYTVYAAIGSYNEISGNMEAIIQKTNQYDLVTLEEISVWRICSNILTEEDVIAHTSQAYGRITIDVETVLQQLVKRGLVATYKGPTVPSACFSLLSTHPIKPLIHSRKDLDTRAKKYLIRNGITRESLTEARRIRNLLDDLNEVEKKILHIIQTSDTGYCFRDIMNIDHTWISSITRLEPYDCILLTMRYFLESNLIYLEHPNQ